MAGVQRERQDEYEGGDRVRAQANVQQEDNVPDHQHAPQ